MDEWNIDFRSLSLNVWAQFADLEDEAGWNGAARES
jgi:hypothetical protein